MVVSNTLTYEEVLGFKFGRKLMGQPKMFSHIYYIDGLLIDTGQSRMKDSIIAATQSLDVQQIFITHHHEDHSGNIKPLQALHNCKVYAPWPCCQLMKNPPKLSLAQQVTWGNRPPFHDLIPISDTIKTNKFCFDLIPIPGHAPDMVALYEPDRKWLFSADLYINSYIGYFLKDESIREQIESTKKILQLDFKVMFCSHNPQLKNSKQQLSKKLSFLESFFDDVATFHRQGCSPKEIFKRLNLRENLFIKIFSQGHLSKMNMVKSVIRDIETKKL